MRIPLRAGDIVAGRYRIERILGRGGMGVVFVARHVFLAEPVAIKLPLPRALLQGDLAARVVREGRAAARLRSEHVARVLDVGLLHTGEPFLVLEYLRGRDLGALLTQDGPLPLRDAIDYVLQASEALAEAHANGIVHRDLKPSNLFLTERPDGSACVKIIDFGVAKILSPAGDDPHRTGSDAVLGTPLFMSPEQMRSSREVDARSDVWSLGAVLFALLDGNPPFDAPSLPEIYQRVSAGPPSLRDRHPHIPEALEAVLHKALAVRPEDRYSGVAPFAAAIAPWGPDTAPASAERILRIASAPPLPRHPASEISGEETDDPSAGAGNTLDPREGSWSDWSLAPEALSSTTGGGSARPSLSEPVPLLRRRDWKFATLAVVGAGAVVALSVVALLHGPPRASGTDRAADAPTTSTLATGPLPSATAPATTAPTTTASLPATAPASAFSAAPLTSSASKLAVSAAPRGAADKAPPGRPPGPARPASPSSPPPASPAPKAAAAPVLPSTTPTVQGPLEDPN